MSKELTLFWQFLPFLILFGYTFVSFVIFIFISDKVETHSEVQERHSSVFLGKWIREFWMWFTKPLFRLFLALKLTPNMLSFLGTVIALASGIVFAFDLIGYGGWVMVLGASFDFFDGRLARLTNQETLAGSFFDSSMDRISEAVTLTGIAYLYRNHPGFWLVMAVYLGSMLTSYTKARGEAMGINYSGGTMQRPERIAYLGGGAIITPLVAFLIQPWILSQWPSWSFFDIERAVYLVPLTFVAVLCNTSMVDRIINIMKLLDKKDGKPS